MGDERAAPVVHAEEVVRGTLRRRVPLLFVNVLLIAICGLVYELLAGAVATYLVGDSVTQFSLVIGLYLSAMGIGAWLSRHLDGGIARRFVETQIAIALFGGASVPVLFFAYGTLDAFRVVLFVVVVLIGTLVGLELPLLMRLLEHELSFKDVVARVLAVDYLGALVASLLFPVVLVPFLGLIRTSLVMGLVNAGVALVATHVLAPLLWPRVALRLRIAAAVVAILLVVALVKSDRLSTLAEEQLFSDTIVLTNTTPYQRIVVTEAARGFQVFLNGNLQLDSFDEYRYHEALVWPAVAASPRPPTRALVLGGGDGLALRELLTVPSLTAVTVVDLDPDMVALARTFPPLAALNRHAFDDPRVEVVHADAFVWVEERTRAGPSAPFDVVIVDFPDPNHYGLGKLYSRRFFSRLRALLDDESRVAVQITSPMFTPRSYWTIVTTMEAAGLTVHPAHVAVPSFGVWGFAFAGRAPFPAPSSIPSFHEPSYRRFIDDDSLATMFVLPPDMRRVAAEVNRLDNQILVHVYEEEGRRWR